MAEQTLTHFGNASIDGADHRGWIVGAFMNPGDLRMTADVEIKWGTHRAGDQRANWEDDEKRTTLLILVSGRFRIDLSSDSHMLTRQGDYAMWGPGVGHSWKAEEDSVVITVRWPGIP